MNLMVRDFIQAGQGVPTGGIPIPSGLAAVAVSRPGPPGANLAFPAAWTALPAVSTGGGVGPVVLGVPTDIVTLLYADPTIALNQFPLTNIAPDGSTMTVDPQTNIHGPDGLQPGDLVLFSNAIGNALQMVTFTDQTQTVQFAMNDPLAINQRAAGQGTILNIQAAPGAYPPTTATRVLMISYYLDAVTDPNLIRLVRQVNAGPPLAIALGMENLQLSYDFVDGVLNPANRESPPPGNSENQIRKANLVLTARSLDFNPVTKQFFRNAVATDVSLRSLSFMDRYQ
jgi:hypothetical protein